MPIDGQRSSATSNASCARSSATPTSRTIRVRPAMSFADSMRHTASIARCTAAMESAEAGDGVAATRCNTHRVAPPIKSLGSTRYCFERSASCRRVAIGLRARALLLLAQLGRELRPEVLGLEHLPNLDLAALRERIGRPLDPLDRLLLGLHLQHPESGD